MKISQKAAKTGTFAADAHLREHAKPRRSTCRRRASTKQRRSNCYSYSPRLPHLWDPCNSFLNVRLGPPTLILGDFPPLWYFLWRRDCPNRPGGYRGTGSAGILPRSSSPLHRLLVLLPGNPPAPTWRSLSPFLSAAREADLPGTRHFCQVFGGTEPSGTSLIRIWTRLLSISAEDT